MFKRRTFLGCKLSVNSKQCLEAAKTGELEPVREYLLENELFQTMDRLNIRRDANGNNSLMLAAANGHMNIVAAIVGRRGININLTNNQGQTAADLATMNGHQQIAELIIDPENPCNKKVTAVEETSSCGCW